MKSIKTKISENAKSFKWATVAVVLTLAVAVLPYLQAFGELGGEPPQNETVPVAVPLSEADISEPSEVGPANNTTSPAPDAAPIAAVDEGEDAGEAEGLIMTPQAAVDWTATNVVIPAGKVETLTTNKTLKKNQTLTVKGTLQVPNINVNATGCKITVENGGVIKGNIKTLRTNSTAASTGGTGLDLTINQGGKIEGNIDSAANNLHFTDKGEFKGSINVSANLARIAIDGTADLNGSKLTYSGANAAGNLALEVNGTLKGGLAAHGTEGAKFSATVNANGKIKGDVDLNSGAILNIYGAGIVELNKPLTLNGEGQYTIKVDGNLHGDINVEQGQELTLVGTGTIVGSGERSVIIVQGKAAKTAKLFLGDAATAPIKITNGEGKGSTPASAYNWGDKTATAGGAILAQRQSSSLWGDTAALLEVNNATLFKNKADAGGAIFLDACCTLNFNKGTMEDNIAAKHEGGGLYSRGTSNIYKANIKGNKTLTTTDWGGGGLFVQSGASLNFGKNATVLINNNTASGLGGGISGCPHAVSGIGTIGGDHNAIAVYGNIANGEVNAGTGTWNIGGNGDKLAYSGPGGTVSTERKNLAQDYYCTFASVVASQNFLTNEGYSWTGWVINESGQEQRVTLYAPDGVISERDVSVGLTAGTPSAAFSESAFDIVITGNTSTTHGGGIGVNGCLTVGSVPQGKIEQKNWTLSLKKSFTSDYKNGDNNSVLTNQKFNFTLYELAKGKKESDLFDAEGKLIESNLVKVCDQQNNASGLINFELLNRLPASGTQTYTFYAREQAGSDKNIQYDDQLRKIEVPVSRVEEKVSKDTSLTTDIPWTITSIRPQVDTAKIQYYVHDGSSGWRNLSYDESAFANKVKPDERDDLEADWKLEFTKSFTNTGEKSLFTEGALAVLGDDATFKFQLFAAKTDENGVVVPDEEKGPIAQTTNDNEGNVVFEFVTVKLAENQVEGSADYRAAKEENATADYTFFVKEEAGKNESITYDVAWRKVDVTVKTAKSELVENPDSLKPTAVTKYTTKLEKAEYSKQGEDGTYVADEKFKEFENKYTTAGGVLNFAANKVLYGDTANAESKFAFNLTQIPEPTFSDDGSAIEATSSTLEDGFSVSATNGAFDSEGKATVQFEIGDTVLVEPGSYWFKIEEASRDDVFTDPCIYVIKVEVTEEDSGLELIPEITEVYYAYGISDDQTLDLTKLEFNENEDPASALEFTNFDGMGMNLYTFSVNAASNEPIDSKCLVDPKIIKKLEGRSLEEGKFDFKLIQLAAERDADGKVVMESNGEERVNWAETEGLTIADTGLKWVSKTGNDEYGMVDFDKASNRAGENEDPSCLEYTAPGTYHYRVVEVTESEYPDIEYSKQIITFTAVIEQNGQGQLECTDMYYGHVENGVNVRYSETDDPTFSEDQSWHPTMTNYAKPLSLQVRKTSALDREQGLEGATYGLYRVSDGGDQADILLGESTSDANGWIAYNDVPLSEGNLYYFKEVAAPAGHTVSEFRSSFFYLENDENMPSNMANGWTMKYTDDRNALGKEASAADVAMLSTMSLTVASIDSEAGISPQSDDAGIVAQSDDDPLLFTFALDGGVYDEATNVEFAKLDTRTHEWVEGASLSVIEKSSGKVINTWISGKAAERLEGKLNVNTTYVLHENYAPEGYAEAADVEFTIDQYGGVTILSGTSNNIADLPNAELQDKTISLYDTMLDTEELITRYNEIKENGGTTDEGGILPKLGDFMKVAGPVIVAIGVILLLIVVSRRRKKAQE